MAQHYHAIGIPHDKIAAIEIDGNIGEWSWVPENYMIATANLVDVISNSPVDTLDFSCKTFVAWSNITNRVYIVAVVYDDYRSVDQSSPSWEYWKDDSMEFAVNPSSTDQGHEGRLGWYTHTIKAHITFPLEEPDREFNVDSGPSWIREHVRYGMKGTKCNDNRYKTIYEISMPLWDEWNKVGVALSKHHRLTANETIRMTIAFDDVDMIKDRREAQWATLSSPEWYTNADYFSLFILDPPVTKNVLEGIEFILK